MKVPNRDLLVMFKQELMSPQSMEAEVSFLHELLYEVERLDNVVKAHELINMQTYKISQKAADLKKAIRSVNQRPFIFLNNKN